MLEGVEREQHPVLRVVTVVVGLLALREQVVRAVGAAQTRVRIGRALVGSCQLIQDACDGAILLGEPDMDGVLGAVEERFAAGDFPYQHPGGAGLPAWTAADRPIEETDVVLWYVFGIHHITRVEDWPIMPADTVSFWLKPFGFFDQNPSIDVAPSEKAHEDGHCHTGVE